MAQLALIKTANTAVKFVDDVIEVLDDSHLFSEEDLRVFNILYVKGTREDVQNRIDQIKIRIESAYYWEIDQVWSFRKPTIDDLVSGRATEYAEVWFDPPNRWRRLSLNAFKYPINIQDLTPEERQILATVDINHPSVDSFIRRIVKDLSTDPANMEEIRDLRNLEP